MKTFGSMEPSFIGKFLLLLVSVGLGRGKLKGYFSKAWCKLRLSSPVDIVYNGLKFRLFVHGNTIETKMLFSSRIREKLELNALTNFLPKDGVFIDVGANVGYYSLHIAHNTECRVIAIEPNPKLVKRLKHNATFNGLQDKIEIWKVALGDHSGIARLYLGITDLGSSSIINPERAGAFIDVKIRPLIDLLTSNAVSRIDALKIDVEGVEDKVLKPFFEMAHQSFYPGMLIIEDSSKASWEWDVIDWMLSNGYEVTGKSRGNVILKRS